ncbi:MAG: hypothetical protein HY789_06290 [Deltaproteobacteria bacterium]|nr:hypothetical protein [Deltaproteobacteria bacterium]
MLRNDSLSPSNNIARMSMEAQQEANELERQRLIIEKRRSIIATIAAIAAIVAAVAAILSAWAAFYNKQTISLFIKSTNVIHGN